MAIEKSPDYGVLQKIIDTLFEDVEQIRRLDAIILAETYDLSDNLLKLFQLLPPGAYTRQRLCDQLNSAITGHGWGYVYGTVE